MVKKISKASLEFCFVLETAKTCKHGAGESVLYKGFLRSEIITRRSAMAQMAERQLATWPMAELGRWSHVDYISLSLSLNTSL